MQDDQIFNKAVESFHFTATDIDYESRLKTLNEIVSSMREKNMLLSEPYIGISDKESLKDSIRAYELPRSLP